MKRYLILYIIATLFAVTSLSAQNKYDRLRYDQMNEQGVWSVGVAIEPVVGMNHPNRGSTTGIFGAALECGYFVADNMRLSFAVGAVNDMWGQMFSSSTNVYITQSKFKVKLGGHWHIGRWDIGGRLILGNTTYQLDNPTSTGPDSFTERKGLVGISYDVGYMISPFFKVGGYYEPSLTFDGGYVYATGVRLSIYLPFVNAVVCK